MSQMNLGQIQQSRKKKCMCCNRKILLGNYQLHLVKCKRKHSKQEKNEQKDLTIDSINLQEKEQPKRQKRKRKVTKERSENTSDSIPCQQCGYQQTLAELDSHPQECPQQKIQCNFCHSKWPKNMIRDHKNVCARDIFTSRSQRMFSESYQSIQLRIDWIFQQRRNQQEQQNQRRRMWFNNEISSRQNANTRSRQEENLTYSLASRSITDFNKGIPNFSIKLIPQKNYYEKQGQNESCSICCVEFQEDEILKDLKCKHDFHSKCISDWLRINSSCPLCKTDLSVNVGKKDDEQRKVQKVAKKAIKSQESKVIENLNKKERQNSEKYV